MPRDHSRRPITLKRNCRLKWVSDLLDQDGSWNAEKINLYFLKVDADIIFKICTSPRIGCDFLAWHPDKTGQFSVRSAYALAANLANVEAASSSSNNTVDKAWDLIWKCNVPQKVRIFAWKVASNSLPTMVNKKKRNLERTDMCSICDREKEDAGHALCRCIHAEQLWSLLHKSGSISLDIQSTQSDRSWLFNCLEGLSDYDRALALMTLWRNWHVRNEITHGKMAPPVEASQRFIQSYVDTLFQFRQDPVANLAKGKMVLKVGNAKQSVQTKCNPQPRWERPSNGWMKLNIDGSFDSNSENGGIGAILRDSSGRPIFACCRPLQKCSGALETELRACVDGLVKAFQWTMLPIVVETDCMSVIQMLNEKGRDRSELANLVQEAKFIMEGDREISIKKAQRSQNRISHFLANKARVESLSGFWLEEDCKSILQLGCDDFLNE